VETPSTPEKPTLGGGTTLPTTGQNTLQLGLLALAAVVGGADLVVAARARKHAHR
jgi:hypothetical protein